MTPVECGEHLWGMRTCVADCGCAGGQVAANCSFIPACSRCVNFGGAFEIECLRCSAPRVRSEEVTLPFGPEDIKYWRGRVANRVFEPDYLWAVKDVKMAIARFIVTLDAAHAERDEAQMEYADCLAARTEPLVRTLGEPDDFAAAGLTADSIPVVEPELLSGASLIAAIKTVEPGYEPDRLVGWDAVAAIIRAQVPGLEALEGMREFAAHDESCIFSIDLSGVNGDEWGGNNARRCDCGFDSALALHSRAITVALASEVKRRPHCQQTT